MSHRERRGIEGLNARHSGLDPESRNFRLGSGFLPEFTPMEIGAGITPMEVKRLFCGIDHPLFMSTVG